MRYHVAVEDIEPNHYIAWVLDLTGCFSSALTQAEAIANVPDRIGKYYSWLINHDPSLPAINGPFDAEVVEVFEAFTSEEDPDYIVNAFFEDDRRPLTYWDVEVALRLLRWSHQELLAVVQPLTPEQLYQPISSEICHSIAGIIEHIAGAENWYFDQLNLALDRSALPDDPLGKLESVRTHTRALLVKLIGDDRITQDRSEMWSARKVLRRTFWHERDHTRHITQLVAHSG
jgi:uncharacterized damage-inducible protein DinB/predicted RNase H-like HicB family nuclease